MPLRKSNMLIQQFFLNTVRMKGFKAFVLVVGINNLNYCKKKYLMVQSEITPLHGTSFALLIFLTQ